MPDMVEAWGRAALGELCWVGPSGPTGMTVVPLVWDRQVCVALPFSRLDVALELRGRRAAFAVTDQVRGGRTTVAGFGRARVRFDVHGATFVEHLLGQEILKYPPTRLRADSLLARRENWWWVARALVTLDPLDNAVPQVGRSRPDQALLVTGDSGSERAAAPGGERPYDGVSASSLTVPGLRVVTAPEWPSRAGERVELYPCDGSLLDGDGRSGYVFGHQHSPDLERSEQWYREGRIEGEHLVVRSAEGMPAEALPPFRLWERFRHHRSVERACRAGIATLERTVPPADSGA